MAAPPPQHVYPEHLNGPNVWTFYSDGRHKEYVGNISVIVWGRLVGSHDLVVLYDVHPFGEGTMGRQSVGDSVASVRRRVRACIDRASSSTTAIVATPKVVPSVFPPTRPPAMPFVIPPSWHTRNRCFKTASWNNIPCPTAWDLQVPPTPVVEISFDSSELKEEEEAMVEDPEEYISEDGDNASS